MAFKPESLEPTILWRYFQTICQIPHCSKNEKPLGDYVLSVASQYGLPAKRDQAGNIVIQMPASRGYENAPTVILQAHLDMVCEKNADVEHDFTKDPIEPFLDGEWVKAKGTTLGADNGIGVATLLALLEDTSFVHGPLELLFTVDEETGLNGARALPPDFVTGKILLNLDSEDEGMFFIGCAGGGDTEITLPIQRKSSGTGEPLKIMLAGLRGGHSGVDIHLGRGNAIQLLARMLFRCQVPFELVHFEGGNKHNAIPREAFAHVFVPTEKKEVFQKDLEAQFKEIQFEYKAVEDSIALRFEAPEEHHRFPLTLDSQNVLLSLLFGLPHGVIAMSQEIPDLVETSNNLAIVRTEADKIQIHTSSRSSIASALEMVRAKIEAISKLAGAHVKHIPGYPSWTPNLHSPLLQLMKRLYKEFAGKEPEIKAVHAGLECGILGEKFPGLDMISFGPELKNPHSPDERVHVPSVARFYQFLGRVLKVLAVEGLPKV